MTQQPDIEPNLEEVTPQETFSGMNGGTKEILKPQPIPRVFDSLYDELIFRCDPNNFAKPYDHKRIAISNELYSQTLEKREDDKALKELRSRAIKELGIRFSTIELYEQLEKLCNVDNYTGTNYDKKMLNLANELYKQILDYADDIEKLEEIDTQTGELKAEMEKRKKSEEEDNKRKEFIKEKKEEIKKLRFDYGTANGKYNLQILILFIIFVLFGGGVLTSQTSSDGFISQESYGPIVTCILILSTIFIVICYFLNKRNKKELEIINSKINQIKQCLQEFGTQSSTGLETGVKGTN